MKNISKVLILFILVLSFTSCENEPLDGFGVDNNPDVEVNVACVDATAFAVSAEDAYNNDNTNADLCNAYKSALQNQISACGDNNGSIQAIIDGIGDCETVINPVVIEISLTVGAQAIDFDQVLVVTVGTTLQVTGESSANSNYLVYFEVEEGAIGMEIINSTFVLTLATTDPDYFPSTAGSNDFSSTITENGMGTLVGTFGGLVTNSMGADISVTSGVINIEY